ncbi:MAG: glycosyltransferase family 2 protein [Waddliaceae bacterium]|jgi:glycosyltransferase involved in cell wall biosynthesis|nr:glycosyltransferase family 2 protein [Waddliaceae bacterium]MBT3579167.1 glycosyltransferase family 2 protein [Waddliaceae bacterium]MBT4444323.1 glycosyltransferase family 2 protein [Waddliaceae bacterium]MBT6928538.1 glycosyltransferase family 2 protein [Waddliaceae bacterium]MBT7264876.1 glycosyltransferase family 2 protein [Waddliaceae bacterium]
MKLSIFVPIYNEEDNIPLLYKSLHDVLENLEHDYEVILVNDGSSDNSKALLDELAEKDKHIKVIHFRRNYGQTAAMMAGIDYATGDVLIPMDGDLQNDPADIPKLLAKLDEGYDVVSGWRKNRKDNGIMRILPSRIANWLVSKISGVKLHDTGCSLKAYRRDVIKGVKLYGEMHRFIPIYATLEGAKVAEVVVNHRPRIHGVSEYGIERTFKVILDLIVVNFLAKYSQKPIYVFGGGGLVSFGLSFISFVGMLFYKFGLGVSFSRTPLPIVTVAFGLMGFMAIFIGILSEILMRTYYESQNKSVYTVDEHHNVE